MAIERKFIEDSISIHNIAKFLEVELDRAGFTHVDIQRTPMVTRIAEICEVEAGRINVKATTTEQLGYTGRGEGIAAHAVVLMERTGSLPEPI